MSAAKKEDQPLEVPTEDAEHEEFDDRRAEGEARRDRRVIPRLGHPELRKNMRFVGRLCTMSTLACIAYIGGMIARHVNDSKLELNKSIFFGVVLTVVAGGISYLGSAVNSYVQNESQQRMIIVSERLFRAMFLFFVTGLILGIANVITWF